MSVFAEILNCRLCFVSYSVKEVYKMWEVDNQFDKMFVEDGSSDSLSTISVEGNHTFQRSSKLDSVNPIFSFWNSPTSKTFWGIFHRICSKGKTNWSYFMLLRKILFCLKNAREFLRALSMVQRTKRIHKYAETICSLITPLI